MVSIIICTLGSKSIKDAIESIIDQLEDNDEIIIVKPHEINLKHSNIKIKIINSKRGLARQRNKGLESRSNEIVWFLDDDVIVKDNSLKLLKDHYSKYQNSLGCEFGQINSIKSSILHYFFSKIFLLSENNGNGRIKLSGLPSFSRNVKKIKNIYCLRGFMMSFHMGRINKKLKFDSFFDKYWWGDDFDFSKRIGQLGKLYKLPEKMIYHKGNASVNFNSVSVSKIIINLNYIQSKYKTNYIIRAWSKLGLKIFKGYLIWKES